MADEEVQDGAAITDGSDWTCRLMSLERIQADEIEDDLQDIFTAAFQVDGPDADAEVETVVSDTTEEQEVVAVALHTLHVTIREWGGGITGNQHTARSVCRSDTNAYYFAEQVAIRVKSVSIEPRHIDPMLSQGRSDLMIYEHVAPEGRFFIEWNSPRAWGTNHETKWVASHRGAVLAEGPDPETVLDAVLASMAGQRSNGTAIPIPRLPASLAEWRSSRE